MKQAKIYLKYARDELSGYPELQEKVNSLLSEIEEKHSLSTKITRTESGRITLQEALCELQFSYEKTDYKSRQHFLKKLQQGKLSVQRFRLNDDSYGSPNSEMLSYLKELSEKDLSLLDYNLNVIDIQLE